MLRNCLILRDMLMVVAVVENVIRSSVFARSLALACHMMASTNFISSLINYNFCYILCMVKSFYCYKSIAYLNHLDHRIHNPFSHRKTDCFWDDGE